MRWVIRGMSTKETILSAMNWCRWPSQDHQLFLLSNQSRRTNRRIKSVTVRQLYRRLMTRRPPMIQLCRDRVVLTAILSCARSLSVTRRRRTIVDLAIITARRLWESRVGQMWPTLWFRNSNRWIDRAILKTKLGNKTSQPWCLQIVEPFYATNQKIP